MAIYISLNNFTDQGVRNIEDTAKRADAVREMAKKFGVTLERDLLDVRELRQCWYIQSA